jgi:hypothetical protein
LYIHFKNISFLAFLFIFSIALFAQEKDDEFDEGKIPTQVRFIRAYGLDNERFPPILLIGNYDQIYQPVVGYSYITIEFDIASSVPPALYAKFVHCTYDWKESENAFLRDMINNRTTIFDWNPAPIGQNFYSYRVKLSIPNQQIRFKFSGNWKVKIYDMDNDGEPIVETRFFIVEPRAKCFVGMFPEFYEPVFPVSSTGLVVEGIVETRQNLVDGNIDKAVIYKNHRWFESYVISSNYYDTESIQYRYNFATLVSGFISAQKRFRIDGLPAENTYRVLNLADLAYYPVSQHPIRPPFSDLRRDGNFWEYDDDGAMITDFVAAGYEDYVFVEFLLDPEGYISTDDVFVVGSFNNWKPSARWQMFYDSKDRYYKLRQWIPRARHNYLYATGKLNIDNMQVERYSYDEYEGNTTAGRQTYLMFIYYHEFEYGGFDSIIAVGASNVNGEVLRYH